MTSVENDRSIKRILCATDTSKGSQVGVNKAAALALHLDAELVVVYVSPVAKDDSDFSAMFATSREVQRLADEMLRHDHAALAVIIEGASANGARVRRLVATGEPADEIVRATEEVDADLVIAGTHGRTGIDKFMLGSVAERLIRTAHRPVMIARNPDYVPTSGYKKILVPTDFSASSRAAFDFAVELGAKDCEIELLHCWRLPAGVGAGPTKVVNSIMRSIDKEIQARGQKMLDELVPRGATITFHAVRMPASQGISDRIDEGGFDLVVMGSQGRSGLSRFLLGSVAENTIHYAPCSVVIVPSALESDA